MEDLNRGLISVRSGSANFVSWRMLGTDRADVAFNLYRGGTRINASPITDSTNYLDSGGAAGASYTVRAVVNGAEQARVRGVDELEPGTSSTCRSPHPGANYVANDASVGDLDGDGQYEIVLKWDPTNAKDNSQSGVTATSTSTRTSSTAPGCGASTSAATSGPARTTPSSRCTTTTATAGRGRHEDRRRAPWTAPAGDRHATPTTATRPATC
jgi:hypothetical protein